jgi:nuclear pore complex protein Nup93
MIIVSAIEEGQRETVRQFEDRTFRAMESDWERTKRQIYEELGHQGTDSSSFESGMASQMDSSVALAPRSLIKASVSFCYY